MTEPVIGFVRLITSEEREKKRQAKQLGLVIDDHAEGVAAIDARFHRRRARVGMATIFLLGLFAGMLAGLMITMAILCKN